MTGFVIDASAAVEYLLRTPLGVEFSDVVEGAELVAPELLDAEVLSALRHAVLRGHLDEARAAMAIEDLAHWPVDRISHRGLVRLAWRYRQNVSTYDAFYIAVARAYDIPLLTADARLARAPNLGIVAFDIRTERPSADAL